jgi:hypothetical protein
MAFDQPAASPGFEPVARGVRLADQVAGALI